MNRTRTAALVLSALLVVGSVCSWAAESSAAQASVTPCSSGLVALTFDDGPAESLTPRLVRILRDLDAPATFFMVGSRIDADPRAARRVARAGFDVGNHSYAHEQLTHLADRAVRSTLVRTRRSARAAGVRMGSLMRPPYGLVDDRVRSVVADLGLMVTLWTVDPEDWRTGTSSRVIAARVLAGLRPHDTNVVLLHDGVANSPASVAAVPRIVRRARARGYCLARLGATSGSPVPPVPRVSVSGARVDERTGSPSGLRFTLRLDRPTSRPTSVLVRTVGASATAASDFESKRRRVRFPVGTTRAVVPVTVRGDHLDEGRERMRLLLSSPRGMQVAVGTGVGVVVDDDDPPDLRLVGDSVPEPAAGSSPARVGVRLSEPSGRVVSVQLVTVPGTADADDYQAVDEVVTLLPGRTRAGVTVPVLADTVDEPTEQLSVVVRSVTHATVVGNPAAITITPPEATTTTGSSGGG